jgi:hypothetical protein
MTKTFYRYRVTRFLSSQSGNEASQFSAVVTKSQKHWVDIATR